MWWLLLTGCWWFPPEGTSASGMAGRLLDAEGAPLAGHLVETVESTVETDPDGSFGLYYKRPDTHVHFIHASTWYRRRYVESDAGSVVEIRLPETRDRVLSCGPFACDVELRWELGPGFSGKRRLTCASNAEPVVEDAPVGEPKITCRVEGAEVPVQTRITEQRIALVAPSRRVRIAVDLDGASVAGCVVRSGAEEAPTGGQDVTLELSAGDTVELDCDGRPARPVIVPAEGDVEIHWSPDGPEIQPPPGLAVDRLRLVWEGGTLSGRVAEDGRFRLPPLDAGTYRVLLGEVPPDAPVPEAVVGVVVGRAHDAGFAGVLLLETSLDEGVVSVRSLE